MGDQLRFQRMGLSGAGARKGEQDQELLFCPEAGAEAGAEAREQPFESNERRRGWVLPVAASAVGLALAGLAAQRLAAPGHAAPWGRAAGAVGLSASGQCAADFSEDCRGRACCNEFATCYEKNEYWANCRAACAPGVAQDADSENSSWSCKALGHQPVFPALRAVNGTPSLFCFLFMSVHGGEPDLVLRQLATGTGIFACDEHSLFSEQKLVYGPGLVTTPVGVPVQVAGAVRRFYIRQDFLRTWHLIREGGLFKKHDWTVKLDPDTMFLPDRLRASLRDRNLAPEYTPVYFANCPTWGSAQGPLEVTSKAAAVKFFDSLEHCSEQGYIMDRGEDWFYQTCMENIGIWKAQASDFLVDEYCQSAPLDCSLASAAFHPLKSPENYTLCLTAALKR